MGSITKMFIALDDIVDILTDMQAKLNVLEKKLDSLNDYIKKEVIKNEEKTNNNNKKLGLLLCYY